jgi:hypothetical protein
MMKARTYLLFLFNLLIVFSCSSQPVQKKTVSEDLSASALKPFGRYIMNNEGELELISSAAHFGFSFQGKSCKIFAYAKWKDNHSYLQYEVDGVYQKRVRVEGNPDVPVLIEVPKEGTHKVWIYKTTEAHSGPLAIKKITAVDLKPLSVSNAPVIEFIGNSITCGAAADPSEVPCGTGVYHDQHNAYMAYGPRVARALKANFVLSSVSGIGVYRNWNSDGPTMPQVYEKVDFQESSTATWDFTKYTPKVVSIALGTNDFSSGDGKKERLPFDSAKFVSSYVQFVQKVKSKYPSTRIALLNSPMINGDNGVIFQKCLKSVASKVNALFPSDPAVAVFFSSPMQAKGCTGHPNVEDHGTIAKELIPFFEKLLK